MTGPVTTSSESARGSRTDVDPKGPDDREVALRLTYVIGTYPAPTTTFIDREIAEMRRLGVDVGVVSIRQPDEALSLMHQGPSEDVRYVLPVASVELVRSHLSFLRTRPMAYARVLAHLLTRPHPSARARLRTLLHFGEAVHAARMIRDRGPVDRIHAHFIDRAATVALVAGRLLDVPYSVTAHANDIYVDPVLLPEKIREARFVATCTAYNQRHLRAVAGSGTTTPIVCVYHGLDLTRYEPGEPAVRETPLLLGVGQLKEKKGFGYLLEACRILSERGVAFGCEIVGDGPLRSELGARIEGLGLGDRVALLGSHAHPEVVRRYREATVFVLPCVTASNGDRDGIPNVVLEAMAMRLPVVSTEHSGIPEVIDDGENGLLVPPGDATALADALERLLGDAELRARLGDAGRRRIAERFSVEVNVRTLLSELVG